ncbi:glutathione transferase [Ranunculus cassubicifolius]
MTVLKLHGSFSSMATMRVLACLYEKEVQFEFIPVDMSNQQHKSLPFITLNPFGLVPVLEDGEMKLFESRCITNYLCKKYKGQGTDLTHDGDVKKNVLALNWIEVESQNYNPAISPIGLQMVIYKAFGMEPDMAIVEKAMEKSKPVLDIYEARLSKTKYLAGDFYSLADLHHFPYTYYLMKSPYADLINSRPHVKAWWEACPARPAMQKVAANMVLGGLLDV